MHTDNYIRPVMRGRNTDYKMAYTIQCHICKKLSCVCKTQRGHFDGSKQRKLGRSGHSSLQCGENSDYTVQNRSLATCSYLHLN